jgi:TRAP-type mannitol/chloroaromatic compound transport system substrate-binding protein
MQGYADFWQDTIEANKKIEAAGIVTTKLSKEDQAKARKLTVEILNEKSAKDPYFKKVWESQKAFIEKFRPYFDLTKFD